MSISIRHSLGVIHPHPFVDQSIQVLPSHLNAQAKAFEEYVVGKTGEEVAAIETVENDHGYSVAADEALYASCTIQITGMMAVIAQAAEYAR